MTDSQDWMWAAATETAPAPSLRPEVPHSARIYDFFLGGKDNFPADREAAVEIARVWPSLPVSMRANRQFMRRVIHQLATEHDIRQFLDLGTGLPTEPNVHQVAQAVHPDARIVYVDNDPLVLVHARALLTGTREGRISYIDADLHDTEAILASPQLHQILDLTRPVAVSLFAILQFVTSEDAARAIIRNLVAPLASGSLLALSTVTADSNPKEVEEGLAVYAARGIPERARTRAEVAALLTSAGLEVLDPGVQLVHRWHPDETSAALPDEHVQMHGAIARKP
ncbi:SAM-dependent methyltransferase [Streptacidiphilus fuscans]|uniref:SAM-dependent methyltransferase n=1 Tax=Streptacidiphilus fuscans TaxID=2789292 RepID=A0A931FC60_9ACTN|nr:SAM-dependent methyltransferase [Streptacidiphilus fuscans]MBF9069392.1 SAM-dependent methyltransferase [Streptacidiphilus fuscans]